MNADMLAANIAAHWVHAGMVTVASLSAMRLLRVRASGYRLVALQLTLLTGLLLPLMQPYAVGGQPQRPAAPVADVQRVPTKFFDAVVEVAPQPQGLPSVDPLRALLLVVVAGVALRLGWLTCGVIRLARFSRRATEVAPVAAPALEAEIGVSPRYVLQTGNRGPCTFGTFRPIVALPVRFDALALEFQRSVICHELLHIKRRDIAVALVEEIAVAILWFHPWAWLLRTRIRAAREQVVDARVVEILGDRDQYVRCLIDISGHDLAPHFSQAGAGMLRPHELRARVDAMFQEVRMSSRHLIAVTFALTMAVGTTAYVAGATLPMRLPAIVDGAPSIVERQTSLIGGRSIVDVSAGLEPRLKIANPMAGSQATGATTPSRLNPATDGPINMQFSNARLRDVLAFIGHATSIVFTGYEESFDEGRPVTIEATIDATAPVESLLDRLLSLNGLTYTVTGPRTVVIARNPLAELRQAQAMLERERRQINTVYPEYPQDALERGIKGTVVVDITVNAAGDVTTAAVASGPQELRASAFKAALGLKYTKGQSTTAMKIAFEYLLTDTSWGVKINGALPNIGLRPMIQSRDTVKEDRYANPDASGAYRLGGDLRPPKKIKDVPPVYPAEAQEARVQGVVIMEVRIDERGTVTDVRPLRSIPLLDQAAIDAVKQWQYEPTLLNGVAVPVIMTVTVNFTLRDFTPSSGIRLQMLFPDGRTFMDGEVRSDVPILIDVPGIGRAHFKASRSRDSSDVTVSFFGEDGQQHLGDVVLQPDSPPVQSPTAPSFGVRLLGVR
jgi:TonB family protein